MGRPQRARTLLCLGVVFAFFAALVTDPDTKAKNFETVGGGADKK